MDEYKWILDIVFFVYPSVPAARSGRGAGGTGFLVCVPSNRWPKEFQHVYGVTNYHNSVRNGHSVIRVNRHDGGVDVFDLDPSQWYFKAGGHDVAVAPLDLNPGQHRAEALLTTSWFLSDERVDELDINAGDDLFMIGRFLDYDGGEVNKPALRFGNISILNAKLAPDLPWRYGGVSHVIDTHSRTGFSGSPVIVYRTAGSLFLKEDNIGVRGHLINLLGIHYAQFPEEWHIRDDDRIPADWNLSVKGLSGMSCVAPASAIQEILDLPELIEMREARELAFEPQMKHE